MDTHTLFEPTKSMLFDFIQIQEEKRIKVIISNGTLSNPT
jgi:hypothetical protein